MSRNADALATNCFKSLKAFCRLSSQLKSVVLLISSVKGRAINE